jgi:hypothetical protein
LVDVRWYPDHRKPKNAKQAVEAIERAFGPTEAGRVDLDMTECGWHVSRAERLTVAKGEKAPAGFEDMRTEVEVALAAAGLVISHRLVPLRLSRQDATGRMPHASKQGHITAHQEGCQSGAELAPNAERIDRRAPLSSSVERRSGERLNQPVWLIVRLIDEAGRRLHEERTIAENISPAGARVATSLWWLTIGDIVQVEEVDQPFRQALATIRSMYVGPDGISRLNLSFMSPFESCPGQSD